MDQSTGRMVGEPNLTAPPLEGLPDALKKLKERSHKIVQMIKTYDQKTYAVGVGGVRIKISLEDKEMGQSRRGHEDI